MPACNYAFDAHSVECCPLFFSFRDLKPNREDSPLTRKIRMLENRLDKAMIKYNEAQSIRKTYEQIVKRLKVDGNP